MWAPFYCTNPCQVFADDNMQLVVNRNVLGIEFYLGRQTSMVASSLDKKREIGHILRPLCDAGIRGMEQLYNMRLGG